MARWICIGFVLFMQICFLLRPMNGSIENLASLGFAMEDIGGLCIDNLNKWSGINKLQELYKEAVPRIHFGDVDGQALVMELAENIHIVLKKKTDALNRSVQAAEDKAKEYDWKQHLQLGDVNYTASKKVNDSDPEYEFSDIFLQKVNFENSSVHIPVEIYEGDLDILNSLSWTSELDEVWRTNREKDPTLLWQYMGTQSGIMRNYPASKWQGTGVDLFDVRRRPWYTQGASSPKDMIILIDTSGSSHGQALALMKLAVKSLLSTLSEDDYVNVAHFSEEASWAGCFNTLVQATYRNKEKLNDEVDALEANKQANYAVGFEFAFEMFNQFYNEGQKDGEGANCNKIIMFFTDGGTDMPDDVFTRYNWPQNESVSDMDDEALQQWHYRNAEARIFTYAVGPTANPIAAVRWIACHNRGHFYKIPAMGAIRSTVQGYYDLLSHGIAGHDRKDIKWTPVSLSTMGLGMMTTVTMPVYNKSEDTANQTILGVMGIDATINELEDFIPLRKLGPNGYSFAISSNGFIVFHPDLKADSGFLADPPNVDFLEVEYETRAKSDLRKKMIDEETGSQNITTYVNLPDHLHVDYSLRSYYYTHIKETTFSLAIVLPEYTKYYVNGTDNINVTTGIQLLSNNLTKDFIAPWNYCPDVEPVSNISTPLEDLLNKLATNYSQCDETLVQHLFFDANVTSEIINTWADLDPQQVVASFVATNGGLTRVYPPSAGQYFEGKEDTWNEVYYKRAFDNNIWMFHSDFQDNVPGLFDTMKEPLILATKAFAIHPLANGYKPAVVGVLLTQTQMADMFFPKLDEFCGNDTNNLCYYVDDGGFLILSSDFSDKYKVGSFLGDIEPELMKELLNTQVFVEKEEYDYQGACAPAPKSNSSAISPSGFLFDLLSVNWWTTKLAWAYLNFNFYSWLNTGSYYFASSEPVEVVNEEEEEIREPKNLNYSCVLRRYQYHYNLIKGSRQTKLYNSKYGPCTSFDTSFMQQNNLILIVLEKCDMSEEDREPRPVIPLLPTETGDYPGFTSEEDVVCNITHRYRKRPACFDKNEFEDASMCGGASPITLSWTLISTYLLLLCLTSPW